MFQLEVLQNQWIILALLGGLALVLTMVLVYLAIWRPRTEPADAAAAPERRGLRAWVTFSFPWILIVLYAAIAVYSLAYLIRQVVRPPNW